MFRYLGIAGALLLAVLGYCAQQSNRQSPNSNRKHEVLLEMMEHNRRSFPDAEEVDIATLISLMQQSSVVMVDVRTDAERNVSLIPNAISAAEFELAISEHQGKIVICYCTIGYRSAKYAQEMKRRGVRVASFNGSIVAWCQAGKKLTTPGGCSTTLVHTYGPQWDLLPPDFQAVW